MDKYSEFESLLSESVLDPIQKTRCRDIFDENDIMHEKVRKEVEERFNFWYKQIDDKNFDILGYKMIGSSTGFQYTDGSDMDIQVWIRMHNGYSYNDTKKYIKILPNNQLLSGTNHPINYFLVDEKNPTELHKVENLYNIDTKKWEKKTEKPTITIPGEYIREISRFFSDGFDLIIGRYKRDKEYYLQSFKLNPEKQEISDRERQQEIDKCTTQLKADIDALWLAQHLYHGFRAEAYNDNNPFKIMINYMGDSVRNSCNELIYKTLDKFEYNATLMQLAREGSALIKEHEQQPVEESYDYLFEDAINEL